jgi:hypothetical protein
MKDARNFIIKKIVHFGDSFASRFFDAVYFTNSKRILLWNGFYLELYESKREFLVLERVAHLFTCADVHFWNDLHICKRAPGILCECDKPFAATWFFCHDHGVIPQRDDFPGFIVYPYLVGIPSFLCGIVALIAELTVQNWKRKKR